MNGKSPYAPLLVAILFAATIIWLGLVPVCQRLLRKRHPAQFEALGSPSFGKTGTAYLVILFIIKRAYRNLGDTTLSIVCDVMFLSLLVQAAVIVALYAGFGDGPSVFSSS